MLANIGQNIELHEDKKWFKIQVDAVNTSTISIGNERVPITAEAVHDELLACNPQYANMSKSIVSKPRWLRAKEVLLTTHRSSLVFATTDEAAAHLILKYRSLAAFGRHCSVRAFQDRPPLMQCRNCLVFTGSVLGPPKDQDWTGPRPRSTWTVRIFEISRSQKDRSM